MKRIHIILFLLIGFSSSVFAQADKWEIYQAYQNTEQVEETNNHVFAVADSSLYAYSKEDNSLTTYSRKNGLSDNKIKVLRYHASSHTLIIAYRNGNIDLFGNDGIYNLPYLKNNTSVQNKTINDVYLYQDYAYISAEVGILVVNLNKKEITDTYRIGSVRSACILNGNLYALTGEGIRYGKLTDNLLDQGNWNNLTLHTTDFETNQIRRIADFDNRLCLAVSNLGIYYLNNNALTRLLHNTSLSNMKVENGKLLSFSASTLYISDNLNGFQTINGLSNLKDASYLQTTDNYWLACGQEGLKGIKKNAGSTSYEIITDQLTINSPKNNYAWDLQFKGGKLWVTGGGRSTDRYFRQNTVMNYDEINLWTNYNYRIAESQTGRYFQDAMTLDVDPDDPAHAFVAYYGDGILELHNDTVLNWYNSTNSPLDAALAGNDRYVRIGGVTLDKNKNLWIANCISSSPIKVLTAEGEWHSYTNTAIDNAEIIDKIVITQNGTKFINLLHSSQLGFYVFDDNGTISDQSDDISAYYASVMDNQGNTLNASTFYSITEDKDGNIWAGTNIGPLVCYNANNIESLRFNRIVLADESDYLLNGVRVNAIAVDGSNQKWIATEGSGVFLVNAEGTEVLENFTTDNSPLPTNTINSIAINPENGKVFFAVDGYGTLSYQGDATEGKDDYSDIHAYPNPVRPEHDGKVIITGLMSNSNVKITDIAGNIVYQTKSVGGQVTWNCRNAKGSRVATGIYLVLAATQEGGESVVTKIMVIK